MLRANTCELMRTRPKQSSRTEGKEEKQRGSLAHGRGGGKGMEWERWWTAWNVRWTGWNARVLARDCRKPRFERAPAMQPRALLCFCLLGILAALVPCTVCLDFGITNVTAITLDSVLGVDTELCGMFNSSSTVPCRSPEFGFAQAHRQVCTAE